MVEQTKSTQTECETTQWITDHQGEEPMNVPFEEEPQILMLQDEVQIKNLHTMIGPSSVQQEVVPVADAFVTPTPTTTDHTYYKTISRSELNEHELRKQLKEQSIAQVYSTEDMEVLIKFSSDELKILKIWYYLTPKQHKYHSDKRRNDAKRKEKGHQL